MNADSLATWFRDVLAEVGGRDDLTLRLVVEDQAYSAALLRSGEALAAVTSDPQVVQGCRSEHLGFLRYRPAATPELAERWRKGNGHDWQRMPVVVFNAQGRRSSTTSSATGACTDPDVVHLVPTSADFHEAVRLGLGWGMLPEPQLLPDLDAGRVVTLGGRTRHDVHLHWQRWRIDSAALRCPHRRRTPSRCAAPEALISAGNDNAPPANRRGVPLAEGLESFRRRPRTGPSPTGRWPARWRPRR